MSSYLINDNRSHNTISLRSKASPIVCLSSTPPHSTISNLFRTRAVITRSIHHQPCDVSHAANEEAKGQAREVSLLDMHDRPYSLSLPRHQSNTVLYSPHQHLYRMLAQPHRSKRSRSHLLRHGSVSSVYRTHATERY